MAVKIAFVATINFKVMMVQVVAAPVVVIEGAAVCPPSCHDEIIGELIVVGLHSVRGPVREGEEVRDTPPAVKGSCEGVGRGRVYVHMTGHDMGQQPRAHSPNVEATPLNCECYPQTKSRRGSLLAH